jgi:GTP-binding protein
MFKDCRYVTSALHKTQYSNRENLPEILFLGRSNVGKSSLINGICRRKDLARVSTHPGKTRLLNFYLIDGSFYLVDAPGYGYAERSREERLDFGRLLEEYLHQNANLRAALLLVDLKVGPTEDDRLMYEYLKHYQVNTMIIATKADKIGTTLRLRHRRQVAEKLGIGPESVFVTSVRLQIGLDELRAAIAGLVK